MFLRLGYTERIGTLANVIYVFSSILYVFMFIDLAASWIFKFDITGEEGSAFLAGILATILGVLGRQVDRGRASGSSLRTLLSFIFGIIGIIIFGGFVWVVVNWSGLLGDRGLFPDHFHRQYLNSGNEYLEQEQYSQAINDFSEAIRLDPEDANAYYNRGIAYGKMGQYEGAIHDYDEAIRLDPEDATAYYNRGFMYRNVGQHEQAILDFDAYIRLAPDDANAYFNRAYEYDELGQYDRAIEDLDEAIRIDPTSAVAYNNRGVAYQSLGQRELAERHFQKAKELGYAP